MNEQTRTTIASIREATKQVRNTTKLSPELRKEFKYRIDNLGWFRREMTRDVEPGYRWYVERFIKWYETALQRRLQ